MSPRSLG